MSSPQNYLTRMAVFLLFVLAACVALVGILRDAFLHNPYLNTLILGVALFGIVLIFRQVVLLKSEAAWLETWRKERRLAPGASNTRPLPPAPRRLASIATLLAERRSRISLSPMALRSLLDGIALRLDESREIARYMTAVLIFLGLLGTFWGLIKTIGSIADVVAALDVGNGNMADIFGNLKAGLSAPLSGMGTAFSSSLFGLAGSLVLGFLDLQAGQAQNRFYNELEETLSAQTRIATGSGPSVGEGDTSVPAYVQALLEQTAESLEGLQRIMGRGEESRIAANNASVQLNERLSVLTDQMRAEQALMIKLAESQLELKPVLARLADGNDRREGALDDATRSHIRNIEVYLARMLEEMSQGRSQTVEEIRSEIKILSRTIAALPRDTMARDKTPPAR
jgi:hypothetical protein